VKERERTTSAGWPGGCGRGGLGEKKQLDGVNFGCLDERWKCTKGLIQWLDVGALLATMVSHYFPYIILLFLIPNKFTK
jgi:hypothetical protein